MKSDKKGKDLQKPQTQSHQPGVESKMDPTPVSDRKHFRHCGKLSNKVALITGGDSGIGKAVAIAFAKEGANIMLTYLEEDEDAIKTQNEIEEIGQKCERIAGDIGSEDFCKKLIDKTIARFGQLDILVNNAGEQHEQDSLEKITEEQLVKTFRTNIFSYFFLTKAALPHLTVGSAIINTASVTAYKGNPELIDYSATKGAIVSFTRSLAMSLVKRAIRVNAVAPGPVWTPLIPASFSAEKVAQFGNQVPMKRAAQPADIAPCYVFLASDEANYITGQVLHPNGGVIVNG